MWGHSFRYGEEVAAPLKVTESTLYIKTAIAKRVVLVLLHSALNYEVIVADFDFSYWK